MSRDKTVSHGTIEKIEDHIAEILNAREAVVDIEVFVLGQARRGHIDQQAMTDLLSKIDTVRIGIKRGHDFGRKVRRRADCY